MAAVLSSSSSSPVAHRLLSGAGGHVLAEPAPFVADLRRFGYALLRCPQALAAPVARALRDGAKLLEAVGGPATQQTAIRAGLSLSYKQQANLKERLQIRRLHVCPEDASQPQEPVAAISEALTAFEAVALASFQAWCEVLGLPVKEALESMADKALGGSSDGQEERGEGAGKGKSVLNLYHYFNNEQCADEPCREHADPGFLTVLCRSSNAALQARLPRRAGGAPGIPAEYEDEWVDLEPQMDAGGAADGEVTLLIAVGETLERLSGGTFASCRHRVARVEGLRFNMAYELRPRLNVWHPWQRGEEQRADPEAHSSAAAQELGSANEPPGG